MSRIGVSMTSRKEERTVTDRVRRQKEGKVKREGVFITVTPEEKGGRSGYTMGIEGIHGTGPS